MTSLESNEMVLEFTNSSIPRHSNTPTCPLIYELTPVNGCQFQCTYCNALGQEKEQKFLPLQIDLNYGDFLQKEITRHLATGEKPIYYFSPKTDCLQPKLQETGVAGDVFRVLRDNDCHYVVVTKGFPTEENYQLMKEAKGRAQVIVSLGMPSERLREIVEPGAATIEQRYALAKRCKEDGIQVAAILEPLLPFDDLSFIGDIMDRFLECKVDHFAVDFARVTHECLERLLVQLPEWQDELGKNYRLKDSHTEMYKTANGQTVRRYSPPTEYLYEKFQEMKDLAESKGATISTCSSFGFKDLNVNAGKRGYICMGINMNMVEASEGGACADRA